MSQVSVRDFAQQIGVSVEKLLDQLSNAGIAGKNQESLLSNEDKSAWLKFLKDDKAERAAERPGPRQQITLTRKTTNEIRQTSRTGAARTVQVEVKKRRTFVKRSVIDAEKVEQARLLAQQDEARQTEHEQRRREAEAEQQAQVDAQQLAEQTQRQRVEQEAQAAAKTAALEEQKAADTEAEASEENKPAEKAAAEAASTPPKASTPAAKTSTPAPERAVRKRPPKGKKSKGAAAGRAELHVTRGRGGKARRKPRRKPVKISSTISDAHGFAKPTEPVVHEVSVPETISVGELAQAMSIKAAEVIKTMMSMGSMVTINQLLDQDTAMLLVEEMKHVAHAAATQDPEALLLAKETAGQELAPRSPVVTVMGHVDHGKTSLLDYIRDAKVASGEAGGITQHIGAYKVKLPKGDICFLDTPGHEAFSAMRVRGARSTDLVILVVAADDGVKPQTIEAISHARAAAAPIIVAINKIDREQADVEKVRQELSAQGIIGEQWGGDVLMNEVSASTGQGVDALLDAVLLQAEVMDLKARATGPASGQVVEARLDKGRGPVATALVQHGVLRKGDTILAGRESGRVRVLSDHLGNLTSQAGPSTPVEIQGLTGVPVAGDEFIVVADERKAREIALHRQSKYKEVKLAKQQKFNLESAFNRMGEREMQSLNLLVKADVQGSVEAISDALEKMSIDDVRVKVVHGMVGGINESDLNLAMAAGASIIAFNVRADASARKLIESEGVGVHYCTVIYDVVDLVKASISGMLSPLIKEEHVGLVEVREVFKAPKIGAIAGSYVMDGVVKRNLPVRVLRDNIVIFSGAIDSLRRFKDDVTEVKNGMECGIGVKNYNDIKVGDQIEVFEIVETPQQL